MKNVYPKKRQLGNKSSTKTNIVDLQRARKLFKALASKNKALKYDDQTWSRELASLRTDSRGWKGLPQETIDKVLDWYCANHKRADVPNIWSANSFVLRFDWLMDCMLNDEKKNIVVDIEVGKQAKRLAAELRLVTWPKGSANQLDVVCQLSFDNLAAFRRKLERIAAKLIKVAEREEKRTGFLEDRLYRHSRWIEFILRRLKDDSNFLWKWFDDYHQRIYDWERWNGIIKPFDVTDKKFEQIMREWEYEKGDTDSLWPKVKELAANENN